MKALVYNGPRTLVFRTFLIQQWVWKRVWCGSIQSEFVVLTCMPGSDMTNAVQHRSYLATKLQELLCPEHTRGVQLRSIRS